MAEEKKAVQEKQTPAAMDINEQMQNRIDKMHKLEERGKELVKVDRFYPSSKRCSRCGRIKETLTLSERIYRCECGCELDRDVNAAINIRLEAMRLKAS